MGDAPEKYTDSGQLEQLLKRAKIEKDGAKFDNVLHCKPPQGRLEGMGYEGEAIVKCSPFLDETISRMKPKVIVALGNVAMRRLTGYSGIQRHRGFVLDGPDGIPVVPTFHPSFLVPKRGEQSSSKWTGPVIWDLLKAEKIAREGWERKPVHYLLDPSPNEAWAFVEEYLALLREDPFWPLAWDIETPGKTNKKEEDEVEELDYTITRINFSFRPRHALTVPNDARNIDIIRTLLATAGPKIGWNDALFDRPVVRANGWELNGDLHDAMNAWHVLQPALPKKLEVVASFYADHMKPWKHLSKSDFAFYAASDADATICNWLGIVDGLKKIQVPEYAEAA